MVSITKLACALLNVATSAIHIEAVRLAGGAHSSSEDPDDLADVENNKEAVVEEWVQVGTFLHLSMQSFNPILSMYSN